MRYLTAEELLIAHQALIERFGGMPGITEAGFARLETAVAAPRQSAFGEDLYPDLAAKAGALAHAILQSHPFTDGNKRVAVAALDLMASLNGATLSASNDAIYAVTMAAAEAMGRAQLIDWVRQHLTATRHLTIGDLVDIRDRFAAADPWRFEIVNSPGLLTALTTPFQAAFGQEAFPSVVEKAAATVFLLIANHPFRDGNKRVAGEALRLFLARNGLTLEADDAELRALTRLVTTLHDPRDERLVGWIAARTSTR
jgi:death-on-curing protein